LVRFVLLFSTISIFYTDKRLNRVQKKKTGNQTLLQFLLHYLRRPYRGVSVGGYCIAITHDMENVTTMQASRSRKPIELKTPLIFGQFLRV